MRERVVPAACRCVVFLGEPVDAGSPGLVGERGAAPATAAASPKIDFAQLDGLSTRAAHELREAEDALISFIEAQEKRDRLYVKSQDELKEKYQFGRIGGVA